MTGCGMQVQTAGKLSVGEKISRIVKTLKECETSGDANMKKAIADLEKLVPLVTKEKKRGSRLHSTSLYLRR